MPLDDKSVKTIINPSIQNWVGKQYLCELNIYLEFLDWLAKEHDWKFSSFSSVIPIFFLVSLNQPSHKIAFFNMTTHV